MVSSDVIRGSLSCINFRDSIGGVHVQFSEIAKLAKAIRWLASLFTA